MTTELLVLRLVHVLGGIFWVGSGLFTSLFLAPTLAQAGPAAGPVMAGLQKRRLFTVLPLVALLTILSGLRLMWLTSGGFSPAYFASAPGRTYAASGGAAILGFLLSVVVARPAALRLGSLGGTIAATSDDATRAVLTAELDRVRRRSARASVFAVALVVLAAAGMAIARYLR